MPGRTPRLQPRAERTRLRLLEAARTAFARDGYAGATVADIAAAAGCSKGAYYFHFASKEEILLALVGDWVESRSRALRETEHSHWSPWAPAILLQRLLTRPASPGKDDRLLLEFWLRSQTIPKVGLRLAQAYRSWRELLVRAFERGQGADGGTSEEEPEVAARLALALHDGRAVRACLGLPTRFHGTSGK